MTYAQDRLRLAILGTRGIPARYGGFETFAEELSTRLAARGHEVTVYGRRAFFQGAPGPSRYRGVNLRYSPTFRHKYLETPVSALFSLIDLRGGCFDAVLLCNAANSPFAWLARSWRAKLLINVDGIERERGKWNALGKAWYSLGESCSVMFADAVVADANVIGEYYRNRYRCAPEVIAYGAQAVRRPPGETMARFGLQRDGFILYVSRLEPENNALGVIEAYRALSQAGGAAGLPLVIVGDAPYAEAYKAKLREAAQGAQVIFTGFQFGESYQELQSNCRIYIQATEVGGTHPALIESMAYGNCVIANGTPENFEVLGGAGVFYGKNDFTELTAKLGALIASPDDMARFRQLARQRAESHYSWDRVVDQYEELFRRLLGRPLTAQDLPVLREAAPQG